MSKAAVQAGLGVAAVAGLTALAVSSGWIVFPTNEPAPTETAAQAPAESDPGTQETSVGATAEAPAALGAPKGDTLAGTPGQGGPASEGRTPTAPMAPAADNTAGRQASSAPLPQAATAPDALQASGSDTAPAAPPVSGTSAPETASGSAGLATPGADDTVPAVPLILPRFDLVRADPEGSTLIAGSAEPGAEVTLLVDGSPHDSTTADEDGGFVIFADLPARGLAQVLTLQSRLGTRSRASEEEVIIAPAAPQVASAAQAPRGPGTPAGGTAPVLPDAETAASPEQPASRGLSAPGGAPAAPGIPGSPAPAPRVSDPGVAPGAPSATGNLALDTAPGSDAPGPGGQNATRATAPGPETAPRPAEGLPPTPGTGPAPDAAEPPTAGEGAEIAGGDPGPTLPGTPSDTAVPARGGEPTVLVSRPEGVEVLQAAPLGPDEVALDAIGYDATGEVFLSGRGNEAAFLRIYLDNTPVTTSRIREDGRWRVALPQVDTGTYTLRIDQLDEEGDVIARVESPFQREAREILAAATQGRLGPVTAVTVQPGDTLWAISRNRYGEGIEYVRVYNANSDQIRDPDLIYPGQVFSLPEGE